MTLALRRVRSVTSRRQLRWIVWGTALGALPFVAGYALPYALGWPTVPRAEWAVVLLGLVPLAFASAIVRYRLMDVEVIIKRALVYTAALAAIAAIYGVIQWLVSEVFFGGDPLRNPVIALLATLVVVLLGAAVEGRDSGGARSRLLSRPLRLSPGARGLRARLEQRPRSLQAERAARASRDGDAARRSHGAAARAGHVEPGRQLQHDCARRLRRRAARAAAIVGCRDRPDRRAHPDLDDMLAQRRLDVRELDFWRAAGIHYFVPCVSKEGTIAVMALGRRVTADPLSSEDMALLAAVAAQAATALENGRLYRQLRMKADELEGMREFSENILESLNDGLAVVNQDRRGRPLESSARRAVRSAARGRRRPAAERSSIARSSTCWLPGRFGRRGRRSTGCR